VGITRTYIKVALQGKGVVSFSGNNNLHITDNNLGAIAQFFLSRNWQNNFTPNKTHFHPKQNP
jgi:hypothetical protein